MSKYIIGIFFFKSLVFSEYYSQCGQDKFVHENFFKNRTNGIFIDIGAHDGISFSNTYFFEKQLGWTGICIEPIPHIFEELQKNRNCLCICGCITTEDNTVQHFLHVSGYAEMLSGLISKYDERHKNRITFENKRYGGTCEIIDVSCYNLNKILEKEKITHVNFLSLDTEGGEFEILQNIDFSKYQIDVITVEDNYKTDPFIPFLEKKGFTFVKTLGGDLVFVNKNFNTKYMKK